MKPVRFAILVMIVVTAAADVQPAAGEGKIGVYSDPMGHTPCINPQYSVFEVYVVYTEGPPVSVVEFEVPWVDVPVSWIADVPVVGTVTGNTDTGIRIDLGGCYAPPVHVLTLSCIYDRCCSFPGCELWDLASLAFTDCNGSALPSPGWDSGIVTFDPCSIVPEGPGPADGEVDVPLDAALSWSTPGPPSCVGMALYSLYFGTDPSPPLVSTWVQPPYDPGELNPGRTYYWQIVSRTAFYDPAPGPVWSFTTFDEAIPVERTTWGRVKALYRE